MTMTSTKTYLVPTLMTTRTIRTAHRVGRLRRGGTKFFSRPEPLWQPNYREQYDHEIETVDELQHLGTFRMKPPH